MKSGIRKLRGRLVLGLTALSATAIPALATVTAQPRGTYEVVRLIDLDDQAHAQYRDDDPRLVGRVLVFKPGMASIDLGHGDCHHLHAVSSQTTPGKVIARAAGPARRPDQNALSYASLGLPGRADRIVREVRYQCGNAGVTGQDGADWDGALAFPIDPSRWALIVYSQVLLVIAPQPSGPARPSFACGRTTTTSEKAICSDEALAGWDRSVASAYRRAVAVSDDPQRLGREQNAWVVDRNACGGNVRCLSDKMRERVDELMQQQ